MLFSKPLQRPGNMKVMEARDINKPVAPGVDFDWRITLTNGSTQPRELLSIEMPHQARLLFTLVGRQATPHKPIRLPPGGTHTQQFKFNSRATGHSQGLFKARPPHQRHARRPEGLHPLRDTPMGSILSEKPGWLGV